MNGKAEKSFEAAKKLAANKSEHQEQAERQMQEAAAREKKPPDRHSERSFPRTQTSL